MIKALKLRKKERERAIKQASTYLHRLKKLLSKKGGSNNLIKLAVLYGSYARGDFHLGSDIDLLIIADCLPDHPLRRLELLYGCVEGEIEPKGYSRKEFLHLIRSHNSIAIDTLTNGIVLLDKGFWKEANKQLKNT